MPRKVSTVLFVTTMIGVIVSVDILFFRNHSGERLVANVGIVFVFAAIYFRFLAKR